MSKFLKILCFILIFFSFHLGAFGQIIVKNDFKVNGDGGGALQTDPAIAIDSVGKFVVVWTDGRYGNDDIYGQMYNNVGDPIGSNFNVSDDPGSYSQNSPDVARSPAGSFVVVWQDNRNGNYDIYAQRYNAAGTAQGGNIIVENGSANQTSPSVAMDSLGNFVVVWQDSVYGNWDIFGLRFNSSGAPQGSKFMVNPASTASQLTPVVAMENAGNFVVSWCDYRSGNADIYAQRFYANGTPRGTDFRVNDQLGQSQLQPGIDVDTSGDFVVTWIDYRGGSVFDIYAQRYDSSGGWEGVNFKVTNENSVMHRDPAVALTPSGEFVINWSNKNVDIYAQKYNSSRVTEDGNFLVNKSSAAIQKSSDIASTGTFTYFVWKDSLNDVSNIYAKVVTWSWSEVGEDQKDELLREFSLGQNYPNPFNPQTSISFYLKKSGKISIKVYNILGQRVRDLVDSYYQNGEHKADWDGKDDNGKDVSTGIYFYQIKTENSIQAKKMVLLR